MPVYVRKGGNWVDTDDVFVRRGGVWREVLAAYVRAIDPTTNQLAWLPAFDRFQEPPHNVRGVSPTHSGGTLTWDAAPKATKYQVLVRSGTSTQPIPGLLPNDGWTSELSMSLVGLLLDTTYTCTVRAGREAVGGPDIISVESNKAVLSTGHPSVSQQNPSYPAGDTYYVAASRSDTWSADNGWGQTAGDVVQGYASVAVRNGYGGVSYSTAYSQLATQLGSSVADRVEVVDAVINRIYRKAGGSGTPTVEAYAWKAVFNTDPRTGDYVASKGTFGAPLEQTVKDDFPILGPTGVTPRENKVKSWATQWVKKAPNYTGMLIYRTGGSGNTTAGYNGYAILRAANTTASEWRLKLSLRWKFDSPTLQNATWTTGT